MKVAAIQMTSGADIPSNLATAEVLLREAQARGAQLAVLPENFAFMGRGESAKLAIAEAEGTGAVQDCLSQLARSLGIWIVAGTLPLRTEEPARVAAALLVFDARGQRVARYDKIHLFDVDIPASKESHRESSSVRPGREPVVVQSPLGALGLAVCYDLRFPELFRKMSRDGASGFVLPSAFTVPTGRAHWETLIRARAVENLAFMVAAAQWGQHENGRGTYGDSMIVDHWGVVLARLASGVGVVVAQLPAGEQQATRARFPALQHRVF
jgi:nitrilase